MKISQGNLKEETKTLKESKDKDLDEESDDDIERDPTAEIIKPSFRRSVNSARQRQIKVSLRRKSQSKLNEATSEKAQHFSKINFTDRFSVNKTTVSKENFEDKVMNQSDKQFIENLIQSTTKLSAKGASISESKNGAVAEDLRLKIRQSTEKLSSVKQQLLGQFKPPLDNGKKENGEEEAKQLLRSSLGASTHGPIKATDNLSIRATRAGN